MKLYGSHTSPYVRHCRIALAEEKIDYDFILLDQNQSAEQSPTKKIPFLTDGDLMLSDSSSILKHVREKSGKSFLADTKELDLFCFTSTLLDSAINVFYLEKDGINETNSHYIQRQKARIEKSLDILDQYTFPDCITGNDTLLRIACAISWGLFRNRFQIAGKDNLQNLLTTAGQHQAFIDTAPFD